MKHTGRFIEEEKTLFEPSLIKSDSKMLQKTCLSAKVLLFAKLKRLLNEMARTQ